MRQRHAINLAELSGLGWTSLERADRVPALRMKQHERNRRSVYRRAAMLSLGNQVSFREDEEKESMSAKPRPRPATPNRVGLAEGPLSTPHSTDLDTDAEWSRAEDSPQISLLPE